MLSLITSAGTSSGGGAKEALAPATPPPHPKFFDGKSSSSHVYGKLAAKFYLIVAQGGFPSQLDLDPPPQKKWTRSGGLKPMEQMFLRNSPDVPFDVSKSNYQTIT